MRCATTATQMGYRGVWKRKGRSREASAAPTAELRQCDGHGGRLHRPRWLVVRGADDHWGSRVKESRLGTVPRARNADRLNGVSAARLLIRCPVETVPVSDVCVETSARGPAPYTSAAVTCEGIERSKTPGRRLPSHDELMTAIGEPGVNLAAGGELTRNVYPASNGRVDVLFVTDDVGSVGITPNTAAGAKAFRCVTDPLN